ncbi:IgaA/UmoB family intracellular growth attenuator [Salmonella enterica subsp. enterica serovar Dublin]|nr:IgaA/UmoB family intracellular growth attenuator [Salmonella enterica subsp. enterica serovar Dublin]
MDLIYPAHWQPYITQDLGQQTDIDIYLDRMSPARAVFYPCMMK